MEEVAGFVGGERNMKGLADLSAKPFTQ